ncbi:hypothetical protein HK102_005956 [Quaeritorhiza haematococci]|nr:hypothetical protein HK102_005956 [Quaeritorhiza haematococci]
MLVLEDIQQLEKSAAHMRFRLKLKELIVAVPEGYSRDNLHIDPEEYKERIKEDLDEWDTERQADIGGDFPPQPRRVLPIVQAVYFVFVAVD